MRDLSIIIPARNEMFLQNTIDDILRNIEADTEVVAVLDGEWPHTPIEDNPRVNLIYNPVSIGQRAATNQGASMSTARHIMKCDAHCAFDKGFDRKMIADMQPDWTMVPRMYNLHAFDWVCECGQRTYQGPTPEKCEKCGSLKVARELVWKPRLSRRSDFMRFDKELHFQYWGSYEKRPESKADIADLMSFLGACWFTTRERFWDLGGLDEAHGSWGQMGTEIACKSWLSGGRLCVNKKTWFAHMFRTQGGDFGFPYPQSGKQVRHARHYSQDLWLKDKWPRATRKFQWLIDKFAPVPGWHDTDIQTPRTGPAPSEQRPKATIVYYTDNNPEDRILKPCMALLEKIAAVQGMPIISVSQKAIPLGKNIVMQGIGRSVLSMYRQVLAGLEAAETDLIFLAEHDLLYAAEHFDFVPPKDPGVFWYDRSRWCVDADTGKAIFYHSNVPSLMCAARALLIEHFTLKVKTVQLQGHKSEWGFSPPKGLPRDMRIGRYKCWMSTKPTIDIRHGRSLTRRRMDRSQFRAEPKGWLESDGVPGWGKTFGRFQKFIADAAGAPRATDTTQTGARPCLVAGASIDLGV